MLPPSMRGTPGVFPLPEIGLPSPRSSRNLPRSTVTLARKNLVPPACPSRLHVIPGALRQNTPLPCRSVTRPFKKPLQTVAVNLCLSVAPKLPNPERPSVVLHRCVSPSSVEVIAKFPLRKLRASQVAPMLILMSRPSTRPIVRTHSRGLPARLPPKKMRGNASPGFEVNNAILPPFVAKAVLRRNPIPSSSRTGDETG